MGAQRSSRAGGGLGGSGLRRRRGTFIVDPDGVARSVMVHDNNVGRSTDETLRVLQALPTGELCPVDWRPGEKTIAA